MTVVCLMFPRIWLTKGDFDVSAKREIRQFPFTFIALFPWINLTVHPLHKMIPQKYTYMNLILLRIN